MTEATADELLSELNIKVVGVALLPKHKHLYLMLLDVLARAGGYGDSAKDITIRVNEPERDGSTMFDMIVDYTSGGRIHIGALRRSPKERTEFHS